MVGVWSALSALVMPVATWVASIEKRLRSQRDRLDDVEGRQEGDPQNPNDPGVLRKVADLERDVERVDSKLDQAREERQAEHARVMDRMDELEDKIDA